MSESYLDGLRRGFTANLAVAASVAAYGSVLGVLAAQKGLTWPQMLIMNFTVFAGSAQFVMVEMWNAPLPVFEMAMAVAVINLRYLLIGASLRPLFESSSLGYKMRYMHMVADENWAMTMAAQRKDLASVPFLFGGGICVFSAWTAGTLTGLFFGAAIANPEAYALDFAFTAVFTALAVSLWQGKRDVLPWIVAAGLALLGEAFLPGKWYVLLGGLGGAFTAMIMH